MQLPSPGAFGLRWIRPRAVSLGNGLHEPTSRLRLACQRVCAASLMLGFNPLAHATSAYWNFNGTGNWDTAGNWAANADGTGVIATVPGVGDLATFNSIGLNSNVIARLSSGINLNGLVFNNTGTTRIYSDDIASRIINLGAGGSPSIPGPVRCSLRRPMPLTKRSFSL